MTRRTAEEWQPVADRVQPRGPLRGLAGDHVLPALDSDPGRERPPDPELPAGDGRRHLPQPSLAADAGGKEPLDAPPPESFGQPWYELVETGRGIATEVKPWEWAPEQKISINQGIWTILEKKSDTEYLVTYRLNPAAYRLTRRPDGTWLLERVERPVAATPFFTCYQRHRHRGC